LANVHVIYLDLLFIYKFGNCKISDVEALANRLQRCVRFTQVAVLPWRYDAEMAPQARYSLRRNKATIVKGLVW